MYLQIKVKILILSQLIHYYLYKKDKELSNPYDLDDASQKEFLSSGEPSLSYDVIDQFWDGEDQTPAKKVTLIDPHDADSINFTHEDYLMDELACDIELQIVEEEGFVYYSGFLGRKNPKLTKKLSKGQKLPTKKLEDFDKFCASEWIDLRNKAYTGY